MSYWKYKPVNQRFKEFVGILVCTIGGGYLGILYANQQSSLDDDTSLTFGIIGAIIGLAISSLVVNTSQKR